MAKVVKGKGKAVATAEPEVKEVAKAEVEGKETNGKPRINNGYKAVVIYSETGLAINVPIRWKKLNSMDIDKEFPILFRDAKGEEVRYKTWVEGNVIQTGEDEKEGWLLAENIVKQRKVWTTAKGEAVLDEVKAYQLSDGKENPVEKFNKSEEFRVVALKNNAEYEDWLPEPTQGLYTIFAEKDIDQYSLYQFAKILINKDQFAVIKIAIGNSFKQYYGLIKARIVKDVNDKVCGYALTMKVSRQKLIEKLGVMPIFTEKPKEVILGKAQTGLAEL